MWKQIAMLRKVVACNSRHSSFYSSVKVLFYFELAIAKAASFSPPFSPSCAFKYR